MFSNEEMYDGDDIIGGNEVQIIFSDEADDEVLNISLIGHEEENSVDLSAIFVDNEGHGFDILEYLRNFVFQVRRIKQPLKPEEYLDALIDSLGKQKREERVYPVLGDPNSNLNKIGKTLFNILKIHQKKFKEFLGAGWKKYILNLFFTFG